MNDDMRKFHSQGGAYTGVEPGSPVLPHHQQAQTDQDNEDNGDSSSNGSTKVDSRSPSAYRGRGGPQGGAYGMQSHGSEVSRTSSKRGVRRVPSECESLLLQYIY